MGQTVAAKNVTLRDLKQGLGLRHITDGRFFAELDRELTILSTAEQQALDRVQSNFLELMEDPPMLENTVKMVVLAPLLDLAGFYYRPFRIETETGVDLELEDEDMVIRGRIDVLVLQNRLWLLVIESKRSDFAVNRAIPQALSYMLANPEMTQPTFGLITNGSDFLFLQSTRQPTAEYTNSRLFSLINPHNELHQVLQLLQWLGQQAIG